MSCFITPLFLGSSGKLLVVRLINARSNFRLRFQGKPPLQFWNYFSTVAKRCLVIRSVNTRFHIRLGFHHIPP